MRSGVARGAIAYCPASCGELIQGELDGRPFHVTAPINLYSKAEARFVSAWEPAPRWAAGPKTERAVRAWLHEPGYAGLPARGLSMTVTSRIPTGKGLASSTADIAAACGAVSLAAGLPLDPCRVAEVAAGVEPTDGVMCPGVTVFDHRNGRLIRDLGDPPLMAVLALDTGDTVDTVFFNRRRVPYCREEESQLLFALQLLCEGFARRDPTLIGRASTISSRLHQRRLCKPGLEEVIELAQSLGAYGVNVAHSGTVIGVLYDPRNKCLVERFASSGLHLYPLGDFLLTGGGIFGLKHSGAGYNPANAMVTIKQKLTEKELSVGSEKWTTAGG